MQFKLVTMVKYFRMQPIVLSLLRKFMTNSSIRNHVFAVDSDFISYKRVDCSSKQCHIIVLLK